MIKRVRGPIRSQKTEASDQKIMKKVQFKLDDCEQCEPTPPTSPDMSFDFDGDHSLFNNVKEDLHSIPADAYDFLVNPFASVDLTDLITADSDNSTIRPPLTVYRANSVDQYELDKRLFSIFIPSILSPKSADHSSKLNDMVLSAMSSAVPSLKLPFIYRSKSSQFPPSPSSECRPPLSSTFPPPSSSLKCRRSALLRNATLVKKLAYTH